LPKTKRFFPTTKDNYRPVKGGGGGQRETEKLRQRKLKSEGDSEVSNGGGVEGLQSKVLADLPQKGGCR
jgi:hypothetical protein